MTLAVDGLVDLDLHRAEVTVQPPAVGVKAVGKRDDPLSVSGLPATRAFLFAKEEKQNCEIGKTVAVSISDSHLLESEVAHDAGFDG